MTDIVKTAQRILKALDFQCVMATTQKGKSTMKKAILGGIAAVTVAGGLALGERPEPVVKNAYRLFLYPLTCCF